MGKTDTVVVLPVTTEVLMPGPGESGLITKVQTSLRPLFSIMMLLVMSRATTPTAYVVLVFSDGSYGCHG